MALQNFLKADLSNVTIHLECPQEYYNKEYITVNFEVINSSENDVLVLKWNTPLEGLRSSCLKVEVNAKNIHYKGMLMKRGTPNMEDFVRLTPGETVRAIVNLGEAYDLPPQGEVTVLFYGNYLVAAKFSDASNWNAVYGDVLKHRISVTDCAVCKFRIIGS